MAIVDISTFIADLKDGAVDNGFHIHDERHFVETYSMRQAWEIDLHLAHACGGPLDIHLSLDVEPRIMLAFEDLVVDLPEGETPPDEYKLPIILTWMLPPLPNSPDLLVLATELAGIGGTDLPLEVSAVDVFASVTDLPERSLNITARTQVSLTRIFLAEESFSETFVRAHTVSEFLLDRAHVWLGEH